MTLAEKNDEIELLKQMDILDEEDSTDLIHEGFYQCPEWPEVFWRRKNRHAKRSDPEISFIKELEPKKVLEVGSAYGRVTRKIIALQQEEDTCFSSLEVIGIEVNRNFQEYTTLYSKTYPELSKVKFIYGSIFDVKKVLPSVEFDVVVIPMNTVPNFPFEKLDSLFKNLYDITKQDGHCIFSVHNQKFDDDTIKLQKDNLGGELLLEKGKRPIVVIFYDFPIRKTPYGFSRSTYLIHAFLNKKMCSDKRIISRSVTEFPDSAVLEDLISKNGFTIDFMDTKTFSKVYVIKKRE